MSEDQEWSRRVLIAGWTARLRAAVPSVRHSHPYTIGAAFRRFFDSGVSAERAYLGPEPSRAVLRRPRSATCAPSSVADPLTERALDPLCLGLRAREARGAPARGASSLAALASGPGCAARCNPGYWAPEVSVLGAASRADRDLAARPDPDQRRACSAIVARRSTGRRSADRLSDASWGLFALGTLLLISNISLAALRWQVLLDEPGCNPLLRASLRAYWIGLFRQQPAPRPGSAAMRCAPGSSRRRARRWRAR